MDEIFSLIYTEADFANPLEIADEDFVYRQVHRNDFDKESRRFPKANHFKLRIGEEELSVNWDKLITVSEIYHLIGISHNAKGFFKDIRQFEVFRFPVSFLRDLENIQKVQHTPRLTGNPAPEGQPNNIAHASVYYPDDEEVRVKLSNYCNEQYDDSFCKTDITLLEPVVEELRQRLYESKYYRCKPNSEIKKNDTQEV